jgi:hypothetical protein
MDEISDTVLLLVTLGNAADTFGNNVWWWAVDRAGGW